MTADDFKTHFSAMVAVPVARVPLRPEDWKLAQPPVLLPVPLVIVHHITQPEWAVAPEND